jgi:hypothetical protein
MKMNIETTDLVFLSQDRVVTDSLRVAHHFATYARNPQTWVFAARRQLAVADVLFGHLAARRMSPDTSVEERSGCYAAAYMHAGLAIEKAAKAVLVSRDPSLVRQDGTLDRKKLGPNGGHGVRALAIAALPCLTAQDGTLLAKLEEHVLWAGRYTIPMNAAVLYDEQTMDVLRLSSPEEQPRISALVKELIETVSAPVAP